MRNRAICKNCNTVIESLSEHHFVRCECGQCYVDGGNSYHRGGAEDPSLFYQLADDDTAIFTTGGKNYDPKIRD